MELNKKVLERTAMFLFKGGENVSRDESKAASVFLEALIRPEYDKTLTDIEDGTLTHFENWLLIAYNKKVSEDTPK